MFKRSSECQLIILLIILVLTVGKIAYDIYLDNVDYVAQDMINGANIFLADNQD